jgi:hypothetical protein
MGQIGRSVDGKRLLRLRLKQLQSLQSQLWSRLQSLTLLRWQTQCRWTPFVCH